MKTLRNKVVGLVKVQWQHGKVSKWTWELGTQGGDMGALPGVVCCN